MAVIAVRLLAWIIVKTAVQVVVLIRVKEVVNGMLQAVRVPIVHQHVVRVHQVRSVQVVRLLVLVHVKTHVLVHAKEVLQGKVMYLLQMEKSMDMNM